MSPRLLPTLALALASPSAWAFDTAAIDGATMKRLVGGGQIVLVEEQPNGRLAMVTGGTLVAAPPQKVWNIITNYSEYPSWMPETSEVNTTPVGTDELDVQFVLDFKFSVISKRVVYTARHTFQEPSHIHRQTYEELFF